MDTHAQPHPRRIVLIDPRFQFRLVLAFLAVQVVLTSLFAFGLHVFLASELRANLASAHATLQNLTDLLMPIVALLAGACLLTSTILVSLFVVWMSHRIAGPLFRFRSVLEDLAARRLPIHTDIRPGDQLQEVSASLGHAVDTLHLDLSDLKRALAALREAQDSGEGARIQEAMAGLEAVAARWQMQGSRKDAP